MRSVRLLIPFIILQLIMSGFSMSVSAEGLYKWKDARGHIQYGDNPPKNVRLESLDIPELTVIQNYADQWKVDNSKAVKPTPNVNTPPQIVEKTSVKYEKFTFIAPKQNQVIHTKAGDVSAMISLRPALKSGHSIVFKLDGKAQEKGTTRMANFSALSVGPHAITASIIDAQGKVVQETSALEFRVIRFNSAYYKKKLMKKP